MTARSNAVAIVMLVDQIERFARERRDQRPERDARRGARRNPHAAAQAEDRIEHGADRVGERPAVDHRRSACESSRPRPRKRARSVSNCTSPDGLAFDDGEMRRPDLRVAGRAPPPRGQQRADIGDELRLHEQLGEGRMRGVGRVRRQHDFGVRGQLDLARAGCRDW